MPWFSGTLTAAAWVTRLYTASAAVLLISLLVFGVISAGDHSSTVTLEYASKNKTIVLGHRAFNLSTAYIFALLFAVVLHTVVALAPSILEPRLITGRNPSRWLMMAFTAPILHTVTLVGIAKVTDVWAVFTSIAVTSLSLLMLYLLESAPHSPCMAWTTALAVVASFVGYWVLVWRVSNEADTFTLGISCFLSVALVAVFAATYTWRSDPFKREAVMQSATLLFEIGMPWLWAASTSSSTTMLTTWTSFLILSSFAIGCTWVAISSTNRIANTAGEKKLLDPDEFAEGEVEEIVYEPDNPLEGIPLTDI